MPRIHPIPAIQYAAPPGADVSDRIAPPYDVLDETSKGALVAASADNIVTVRTSTPGTPGGAGWPTA